MAEAQSRLLIRREQPETEPLSLAEAKLFLRVDGSAEDSLITDIMVAAREAAEEYMQRSLITQTWALIIDDYAPSQLPLPRGPVQSITSVKIIDRGGDETLVDESVYYLNAAKEALCFDSQPMGHQIEVEYITGFGGASDVPQPIRQGVLIHAAALYDNRISGIGIPPAALLLYQPYRVMRL